MGTSGSWRKLLKLRDTAKSFVRVEVRDGLKTHFWYDSWSDLGRLIDISGYAGMRHLGIPTRAMVADACRSNQWQFRRCRDPATITIVDHIMNLQTPSASMGQDITLWRHADNEYKQNFSAKATWNNICHHQPRTSCSKIIWFSYATARFSFIAWLALQDKLATSYRTAIWGNIHPCMLCGERSETRDHLFFACPFAFTIWSSLCCKLLDCIPTPDWSYTIASLTLNRKPRLENIIYRMLFQTTLYYIWRERNNRLHNTANQTSSSVFQLIIKTVTDRIRSRRHRSAEDSAALLERWLCYAPSTNNFH